MANRIHELIDDPGTNADNELSLNIDASRTPADITYQTDLKLFYEARGSDF